MNRITDKNLQAVVDRINRTTGSPMAYRGDDGVIAVGHYTLSGAYGGVSLHRICNTSGGCSDVFGCGHIPKRALYDLMHAWIKGFETGKGE